jgi:hypothetical protein
MIKGYCLESFINHQIEQLTGGKKSKQNEDEEIEVIVVEVGPNFKLQSSQNEENPEILG